MKKSRGSETVKDEFKEVTINFGTIDKADPKTVFIKMCGWANVIDYSNDKDYGVAIRLIDKRVRRCLYKNINKTLFRNDIIIVDFDMRESGILGGKPSFFGCEIILSQIKNYELNSDVIDRELKKLTKILIKTVFKEDENFNFHKNKKIAKSKILKPIL